MKYKITLGVIGVLAFAGTALANSSFFLPNTPTATATTTVAYMTPGTGTTTLSYDSFQGGQYRSTDKSVMLIQFTASSTLGILNWRYEYSVDGVDWYGDSLNVSTSTSVQSAFNVAPFTTYTWTYASSTLGTSVSGTAFKAVTVPTPTRYFRAVFTDPIGAGNASVWAQFVPQREALQ